MTTASKLAPSNPSASASPSRNSMPGWSRRARSTIAREKTTAVIPAPRAAAATATYPGPVATSSARVPMPTCAASSSAATDWPVSEAKERWYESGRLSQPSCSKRRNASASNQLHRTRLANSISMPGFRYATNVASVTNAIAETSAALSHSLCMLHPLGERLLVHGQVDDGSEDPQADRGEKRARIGPGVVVEVARQPDADEAADLVAEEHDRRQHRRVAHAEDLPHQAVGERHRAEPQQADADGERVQVEGGQRKKDQHRDQQRPHRIDGRQQVQIGRA